MEYSLYNRFLCISASKYPCTSKKLHPHKRPHRPQKTRRRIITRVPKDNTPPEVTLRKCTGPLLLTPVRSSICLAITRSTPSVSGYTPLVKTPNNVNVEGRQNATASTSAPSTNVSTVTMQVRPITSFVQPELDYSTPAGLSATASAAVTVE